MKLWRNRRRGEYDAEDESQAPRQQMPFLRPRADDVPVVPGQIVIALREVVRGVMRRIEMVLSLDPPLHARAQLHCDVCGSEFSGKWRLDGSPIYTSGVLRAKVYHRDYGHMVRRVQRCRCEAGRRHGGLADATDWTWAAALRRNRLASRAGRRMTTAEGRRRMLLTWTERQQVDFALRVAEYRQEGADDDAAERRAYVEIGDAMDTPIRRPWKRAGPPVQQEVML